MMILHPFGYTPQQQGYTMIGIKNMSMDSYSLNCKIECAQVNSTWKPTLDFQQLQSGKIGKMFKSEKLLKLNELTFNVIIDGIKRKRITIEFDNIINDKLDKITNVIENIQNNLTSNDNGSNKAHIESTMKNNENLYKIALQQIVHCVNGKFDLEKEQKFMKCNVLRRYLEDQMSNQRCNVVLYGEETDDTKKFVLSIKEYLKKNPYSVIIHDPMIHNHSEYGNGVDYDQSKLIKKYKIDKHPRINALNGEWGVKTIRDIGRFTCLGEYYGRYMFVGDQEDCYGGTRKYDIIDEYAFMTQMKATMPHQYAEWFNSPMDQGVIPKGLRKYYIEDDDDDDDIDNASVVSLEPAYKKQKIGSTNNYKNKNHNYNTRDNYKAYNLKLNGNKRKRKYDEITDNVNVDVGFQVILDAYYVEKRCIFTFVNDARKYLNLCVAMTDDELKYVNTKFVTCFVNGWPRTFAIATKDIKKDEELFADYGPDYGIYLYAKNK